MSGLFTHYSGAPFSITSSATSCNYPANTQTANQVLPNAGTVGSGLGGHPNFNPLAFAPATTASFGNAGFDTLRGPGRTNLNPASNLSSLQLNPRGSVKNLNRYDTITSVNPLGRLIDPRHSRFGLRIMF